MPKSNRTRRGFTLVELIVVLVILAILAALLVPALTGYIDKANRAKIIAQARSVLVASQATVSEAYGKGELQVDAQGIAFKLPDDDNGDTAHYLASQILTLSEIGENDAEWRFSLALADNTAAAPATIDVFEFCNKQYCITYRAFDMGDDPAGWSEVTPGEKLPSPDPSYNTIFLKSSDFTPDHYHK